MDGTPSGLGGESRWRIRLDGHSEHACARPVRPVAGKDGAAIAELPVLLRGTPTTVYCQDSAGGKLGGIGSEIKDSSSDFVARAKAAYWMQRH
jgi:hypothetical protein